ncbi:MAG: transcription antitermination factor NusB [Clostridia bacterium]|nr:transcription antitermination factor NusB [Clostridia bacterium]
MSRSQAREAAMQLVFEQLFGAGPDDEKDTLVNLIEYQPDAADQKYIDEVVGGVAEHAAELDADIASCLRGWTLERISRVDRAIMRLAVYEFRYTGLPASIAINEALELVRKYSSEESTRFVNGVLGTISRRQDKK